MWKSLYDSILQTLAGSWAKYLSTNGAPGRLVRETFFNTIYPYSGLILIAVIIIATLLYYFYFNRRFGRYYKLRCWLLWMLLSSLIIGITTYFLAKSYMSSFLCPTSLLVIWQSVINFFWGIILFLFLSIFCQLVVIAVRKIFSYDLSPMGNRTPF